MSNYQSIFVFGSNLKGYHGAGSAQHARLHYGAIMGQGEGLQGNSYAIPTKDENMNVLPLEVIAQHVQKFYDFVRSYTKEMRLQEKTVSFNVVRVGCGYAGYTDEQMAPLFRNEPQNVYLDHRWYDVLYRQPILDMKGKLFSWHKPELPIMYLDVDGVILRSPRSIEENEERRKMHPRLFVGVGAEDAKEFILWALDRFEVRWMTAWTSRGWMHPRDAEYLSEAIGLPAEVFTTQIFNPLSWGWTRPYEKDTKPDKYQGIDFEDPRPFIWLEDGIGETNHEVMEKFARPDQKYRFVDSQHNPTELKTIMQEYADGKLL